MGRPDVDIELKNGAIGGTANTGDGICAIIGTGVAVVGKLVLGEVVGPILSAAGAAAYGIDASYDNDNKVLLYRHISDFYDNAPEGTKLYIMAVPETVTMESMADKGQEYGKKLLEAGGGAIKMLAISRVPAVGYAPLVTSGFDDDSKLAAIKAQELIADEFAKHRPVRILIEGRDFQKNATSVFDHRGESTSLNLRGVMMVVSADNDVSASDDQYEKYANVGFALGKLASIGVQRNIGRVKSGSLPIAVPGLSSGELIGAYTEIELEAIHDRGYVLIWNIAQISGFYFSDDPTLTPLTDDYGWMTRGRVIDKAARLLRQSYVTELLDDMELEEGGKLSIEVVKYFEDKAEKKVLENMKNNGINEISAVSVYVDPDQDVLTTDKWIAVLGIRPRGMNRNIEVELGYTK